MEVPNRGSSKNGLSIRLSTKYTQQPYLVTAPDRLFEELGARWLQQYGFSAFRSRLLFDTNTWVDLIALPNKQQVDLVALVYYYRNESVPNRATAEALWGIANRTFFITFCGWGNGLPEPLGVIEAEPLLELLQETEFFEQSNHISARGVLWEVVATRNSAYNPYPRGKNTLWQIKRKGDKVIL